MIVHQFCERSKTLILRLFPKLFNYFFTLTIEKASFLVQHGPTVLKGNLGRKHLLFHKHKHMSSGKSRDHGSLTFLNHSLRNIHDKVWGVNNFRNEDVSGGELNTIFWGQHRSTIRPFRWAKYLAKNFCWRFVKS